MFTMRLFSLLLVLIIYSCVFCQNNSLIDKTENISLTISLNVTQNSTQNTTEDYSTETPIITTLEPLTTTETTEEVTEEEAYTHYMHYSDDYCTCDLKLEWCDIDCCCDPDCNDSERSAFGQCIETRKKIYDSRYCHYKDIVYINNTKATVEKSFNGLFCIVWDNTNEKRLFEDIKPINDLNKILNITAQHNYNWSQKYSKRAEKSLESEIFRSDFKMKSGKNILIANINNETKIDSIWKLPNSRVIKDGKCNSLTSVKYLRDFNSTCYQLFKNLTEECPKVQLLNANYYKSFRFISRNFMNKSDTNQVIIDINPDKNFDQPFIDSKTKECKNVVKSVHYIILHNGSNGIIEANLKVDFTHLKPDTKWFKQSFSTTFLWFNKSDGFDLSGNPGYLVGKPILAAFMMKDKTNLTQNLNGYPIMTHSNRGFCDLNSNKESIKFGINVKSGCLLRFTNKEEENLCESIQKTIVKLLEPEPYLDYIGVFGNSSSQVLSDWTRILDVDNTSSETLNENLCPILVTGISLHFYYIYAGSANQPQAKIVGLVKRYHTQTDVIVKCHTIRAYCNDLFTEISTSVTFYDITKPSRPDYAPPPVFKIQLPSDFFYPFLKNSQFLSSVNNHVLYICICISYLYLSFV